MKIRYFSMHKTVWLESFYLVQHLRKLHRYSKLHVGAKSLKYDNSFYFNGTANVVLAELYIIA